MTRPTAGTPLRTRRQFLRAGAAATFAAIVAACAKPADRSTAPSAVPSPTVAPPSPGSSPSPATAPPTPGPPLREIIGGLLVVGFRGATIKTAGPITKSIAADGLGGVILFDRDRSGGPRNVRSPAQLERLTADLQGLAGERTLLVAIDQEGGRVNRLKAAYGFPAMTSEADIGRKADDATTRAWATVIAETLASTGINLNLAPVVDVDVNPRNPAIGALDRSFSSDPAVVEGMARIEIESHRAAGVATSLKHFPGLGSATANTDFGVADVTDTWSRGELAPFEGLIGSGHVDTIMAANLVNQDLDPDYPASLSSAIVTDLLRGELGWDGVVITDDLQAGAITDAFGADEAIARAIEAGCDLLLFANQQTFDADLASNTIDTIEGFVASGRITVDRLLESRARIERLVAGLSG